MELWEELLFSPSERSSFGGSALAEARKTRIGTSSKIRCGIRRSAEREVWRSANAIVSSAAAAMGKVDRGMVGVEEEAWR